ncbi:MAG TPA: GLPGLI family protein [Puia sp.]|nr:GLPGLI family protein [Puia sp.]
MKDMKLLLTAIVLFFYTHAHSQNSIFLSHGRVEFERKVNLYAQIDDDDDDTWKELAKKMTPKFKSIYFNLYFDDNKTLYKPGRDNPDNNKLWQEPAEDNIVFTDLSKEQAISEKNIFDQKFLVQDTARKIKWKITNETKNIAGFECRRANALIMDSVYIVAFYTDEITTPGGPESFSGLPGMILGVAIPHEHITWFATKVYNEDVSQASLIVPTKGKKVTNASMYLQLKDALKDWGKWGKRHIKAAML